MAEAKQLLWKAFERVRNFLNRDGPEGRSPPPPIRDYHAYATEHDEEVAAGTLLSVSNTDRRIAAEQHYRQISETWSDALTSFKNAARHAAEHPQGDLVRSRAEDTAATLLLDHSGSMRDEPIALAASLSLCFAEFCKAANIPFEILGFTTVAWKGTPVREQWIADGRPFDPGRLCALQHIVYSEFDDSAEPDLTAMFLPNLLKENIDGEALEWAAARFESVLARRKILIPVSDGAPVDDSTLAENPSDYLWNHLKTVISELSTDSAFILRGVGIDHDVKAFYPASCRISGIGDVESQFLPMLASTAHGERNSV